MTQYAKCRKAINRFLQQDRIGAIGHISCVDRRPRIAESADIAAMGASSLEEICDLLGYEPTAVTVQSQRNERVTSLQAFLHVSSQTGIHYFATFGDSPREHELWIEGSKGSLRTDGNSVWWRKRGWPVFIPTRIGLFGIASRSPSKSGRDSQLAAALRKSECDRNTVSVANRG